MNKPIRLLLLISFSALIPLTLLFMKEFTFAKEEESELDRCVPYNMSIEKERFSAKVSWNTHGDCAGFARVDLTPNSSNSRSVPSSAGFLPASSHTVIVPDLKPATTYYIWIYSEGKPFGNEAKPIVLEM